MGRGEHQYGGPKEREGGCCEGLGWDVVVHGSGRGGGGVERKGITEGPP